MKDASFTIRNTSEYKEPSVEEAIQLLQSSTDGLTESEVERRLQTFGFNEVTEKRSNPVLGFLKRYWGPMPWLLELAIVLSVVLKRYLEAEIILG
jgi:H+-transporting ATPase